MTTFTEKDYEAITQMSREDMLDVLQITYDNFMKCTEYEGQKTYIGNEGDFISYTTAQAISMAVEMIINICDFVEEMKSDLMDEEGEEQSSFFSKICFFVRLTYENIVVFFREWSIIKLSKEKEKTKND